MKSNGRKRRASGNRDRNRWRRFPDLRPHDRWDPSNGKARIGQRHEGAVGVLGRAALAHLGKAPQPLDHLERMLNAGSRAALVPVAQTFGPVDALRVAHPTIREVARLRSGGANRCTLPRVTVALHALGVLIED
jgi:hypothetical protein